MKKTNEHKKACIEFNIPDALFPKSKISQFILKLKEFKDISFELSSLWSEIDHTGAYFCDGYPFDKSFDELTLEIHDWYEKQVEKNE